MTPNDHKEHMKTTENIPNGSVSTTATDSTQATAPPTNHEKNHSCEETTDELPSTDSDAMSTASDESPPVFLYSRLNQLPRNLFDRDPVSCSFFSDTLFVFATHSGLVHVCKPDITSISTYKAHSASVLAIDSDGTHVITASMDGSVVVSSIAESGKPFGFDFKRPVHAVAIDRKYAATKAFYAAGMDGKVVYSTRNWLGNRTDSVLHSGDSPIVALRKVGRVIVWMNDQGIFFFDTRHRSIVKKIARPQGAPRGDLYWPRLHFSDTDRVLVAWGNYVWSIRMHTGLLVTNGSLRDMSSAKSRVTSSNLSTRSVAEKRIEIEHFHELSYLVAGISAFNDDKLLLLCYEPPVIADGKKEFQDPDLKIVNLATGDTEFEEEIGLRYNKNLGLNDYSLGTHIGRASATYYIMSAKDAVIAKEVQLNDRLNWYIERENNLEAWRISEHLLSPMKRLNLGVAHVDSLIRQDEWTEAATFLLKILHLDESQMPSTDTKSTLLTDRSAVLRGDDDMVREIVHQWESWAGIFLKSNHIDELTAVIPTIPHLNLPTNIYNEILAHWLKKSRSVFFDLVAAWDISLYSFDEVTQSMETVLESERDDELRRCLADLYIRAAQPQKAVAHLALLKDQNLIKFLHDHHLMAVFLDRLPEFIELSVKDHDINRTPISDLKVQLVETIEYLVDARHELPPQLAMETMAKHQLDFINLLYLDQLEDVDDHLAEQFLDERVVLYGQYNRKKLLPFLKKHSTYDIQKAIKTCEDNDFVEESVYLWGEMGQTKKALELIITKLDDPEAAINFAKDRNDKEAWDILLEYSMDRPAFIKALIEQSDEKSYQFYDPITILEKMPEDVVIAGLKDSVTKISYNNRLNLILGQLVLRIVYNSSETVSRKLRKLVLQGYEVDIDQHGDVFERLETVLMEDPNPGQTMKTVNDLTVYLDLAHKLEHLQAIREQGSGNE